MSIIYGITSLKGFEGKEIKNNLTLKSSACTGYSKAKGKN
jgi:hypothetical protein